MKTLDLDALNREARAGAPTDVVPVTRRWLHQVAAELQEANAMRRQQKIMGAIDAAVSSGAPA